MQKSMNSNGITATDINVTNTQTSDIFVKIIGALVMETWSFTLFVFGISLTSGQLINELFPECTRSCFSQVVLCHRGSDRIYQMRCLFVALGPNACFIALPHRDNMS